MYRPVIVSTRTIVEREREGGRDTLVLYCFRIRDNGMKLFQTKSITMG